jgi:hypothetical protein
MMLDTVPLLDCRWLCTVVIISEKFSKLFAWSAGGIVTPDVRCNNISWDLWEKNLRERKFPRCSEVYVMRSVSASSAESAVQFTALFLAV